MKKYYEKFYANKVDNLHEKDKFLGTYNLPKVNQEKTDSKLTNNNQ